MASVYARGVNSGNDNTTSSENSNDDRLTEQQKQALEQQKEIEKHQNELEQRRTEIEKRATEKLRERAEEINSENEDNSKKHTDKERKKNCETRKNGLEKKLANINLNAQKHKTKIDKILDKTITYISDNNISEAEIVNGIKTATDAKATAAASIEALNDLDTSVDCGNGEVAAKVSEFKAAAEQVRNDLRSYKTSVKTVLEALENLKNDSTSEGDNNEQ